MKEQGIKNISKEGAYILMLKLVQSAIYYEEEDFFNEDIGQNILFIIQQTTGLTLNMLRELVEEKKYRDYDQIKEQLIEDSKTMTLSAMAKKFSYPRNCLKNYCIRNNIRYRLSKEIAL